ncbi:hypothetical protein scyTo_0026621, partial [Scyliorhinus torazame]|nr:hypothetical protein [Scyliorhinus torazame]
DSVIKKVLWNHDHVWKLVTLYQETVSLTGPESPHLLSPQPQQGKGFALCVRDTVASDDRVTGTFGSVTVGNRIEIPQDTTAWSHHLAKVKPCPNMLSFAGSQEESSLKEELPRSARMLCGNWLAYWQYEIGLSQHDTRFYFHQIRLQHFTGHLGTVKCLSALSGEDFFLSASRDKTVRLWPLYNYGDGTREMEPRLTYSEHRKSVFYVHQAEALQQVVSCDGSVHIWDQFTGKRTQFRFMMKTPETLTQQFPASC